MIPQATIHLGVSRSAALAGRGGTAAAQSPAASIPAVRGADELGSWSRGISIRVPISATAVRLHGDATDILEARTTSSNIIGVTDPQALDALTLPSSRRTGLRAVRSRAGRRRAADPSVESVCGGGRSKRPIKLRPCAADQTGCGTANG
jgi:hypothetical protein